MNYIELAGQAFPIQFGYGALMEYEAATGKSAVQMADGAGGVGFTEILTLIACGLTNGAESAGASRTFTAKDLAKLLDNTPDSPAVIAKAMEFLQASFVQAEQKKTVKMQPVRGKRKTA